MIKSLLHFNNPDNLTKDDVRVVPWIVNGTVASSQDGKFRNCLSMTGSGYLQNNTIDLSLDKTWTLDMWVYANAFTGDKAFFSVRSSQGNTPRQGIFNEGNILYIATKSNSWATYNLGLPVDEWVHFALVNNSSLLYAFVNGIKKVEHDNTNVILLNSPEVLIGRDRTGSNFIGLVDEFRISDNVLWTSNFTPPIHESSITKFIFIDKNNTVMGMKE